jgi:hypothetical protein
VLKDHTRYLGDDKPIGPTTDEKDGLDFYWCGVLPDYNTLIEAWHPDLRIRQQKNIDGTSHHYL